jgi:hypothetical protein
MSERDVGQVGRVAGTTVERRDGGVLVLWFVAVTIVDDVSSVTAVSAGVVIIEIHWQGTSEISSDGPSDVLYDLEAGGEVRHVCWRG